MYIKLNNGVPETYTIGQLRKDNPNTSFPKQIPPATLEAYGMFPVFDTPKPTTGELQTAVKDGYELDAKGNWVVKWRVQDMFSDQVDENGTVIKTKAEQEAAYLAERHEQKVIEYTNAVQNHLDSTARDKGYDSIMSLCTYATSTNSKFAAEGQAGVAWRDAVWTDCYTILANVESGVRTAPTVEELIAELPQIVWPT